MNKFLALILCLIALPAFAAEKESAFERVMKTQTIRCGYGTSKPWIWHDLSSDKMVGMNVEIMEEVARQTGLKLEWPEETGWADLPASLFYGRVDVACSILWNDPTRGKLVAYTRPLFYTALYAWVREDDNRFTGKPEELNSPEVKIAVQEGDANSAIAQRSFPKAQLVSLGQQASWTDNFMNVATGKADVVFVDSIAAANFNNNNPDKKLKKVPLPEPVAVYGNALAVGIHETALKETMDAAVNYMLQVGLMDSLTADFRKQYPDAIILPAKPYETQQ